MREHVQTIFQVLCSLQIDIWRIHEYKVER